MNQEEINKRIARKNSAQQLRSFFVIHELGKISNVNFELDIRGRKFDDIVIHIHTSVDPNRINEILKDKRIEFFNLEPLKLEYINFEETSWNKHSFFFNFKYKG